MLCPEVWIFPLSQNKTSHEIGTYDKKAKQSLNQVIRTCAFNKMVSIILPDCETVPAAIEQLIDASDYYWIRDLKLCDLVRRDFVEAFIKRGKLTGISSSGGLLNSSENVFAITPDGKLILCVSKDLYRILGLEGRPAGVSKRSKERFEIIIDLKRNDFSELSKLYNRILCALSNPEIETFDFQLYWESIDDKVCPSSIAKFFHDAGYKVEQHSLQMLSTKNPDLRIPSELFTKHHVDSDLAHEVTEYLATLMLECDTQFSTEINSYTPSFDFSHEPSMRAVILHCSGLLTVDFLTKLMELARQSIDSSSLVFNVSGCENAPLKRISGYTITLFKDKKYFLFRHKATEVKL